LLHQAQREVPGFKELLYRFERTVSVLGRSEATFNNYSRHVAAVALYFGKLPTALDPEQIHDYLFYLQKKSKTPHRRISSIRFMG
jgi:integrase/recombinase XerD